MNGRAFVVVAVTGAFGVAAACAGKTTAPDAAQADEGDADVPETSAAMCTQDDSCQLSRCCGRLMGRRADLDRKCTARDWTQIGCMRTADGRDRRCSISAESNCVYRETDAGLEVYGPGFQDLPRGFRHCDGDLTTRYYDAVQGGTCP
jgi:hypothetical protein